MAERCAFDRTVLPSDPARFREVRAWIESLPAVLAEDGGWTRQLTLAVQEALTNVHRHAYDGRRDGRLEVEADDGPDRVVVRIRHWGTPYRPVPGGRGGPREPSERGGYGLELIERSVDAVRFRRTGDGTEVELTKRKTGVLR